MSLPGRWLASCRAVFLRRRIGREMREEMQAHIELAAERFMARGMSEREAYQAARREFGNATMLHEEGRDARGGRWIGSLAADLHYALRYFRRTPAMTATIIVILTIGITVSAAVYTIADAAINEPPPGVEKSRSLVFLRAQRPFEGRQYARKMSFVEVASLASLTQHFDDVAAWTSSSVVAALDPGVPSVSTLVAEFVTPNYFRTLGVRLTSGSAFTQPRFTEHDPPEFTVVVSHALAEEKFGGASNAVGKVFNVNGMSVVIVGVAPPRFNGVRPLQRERRIWFPLSAWRAVERMEGNPFASPDSLHFEAVARLGPSARVREAQRDVTLATTRVVNSMTPRGTAKSRPLLAGPTLVVPLRGDPASTNETSSVIIASLAIIVLLILLVCTTTVSSLLIAMGAQRRSEIAVRLALGASRARIVRQLLTESTMVAVAGGVLGLSILGIGARALADRLEDFDFTPDAGTLAVTVLIVVLTSVLCGLSPALHATRQSVSTVLKDSSAGSTSRSRLQRTFVVAQVALAQPLLVCLAMFVALIVREIITAPHVTVSDEVVIAEFDPYAGGGLNLGEKLEAVRQRIAALPGVRAVLPNPGGYMIYALERLDDGALKHDADKSRPFDIKAIMVAPGYFDAMDMPLMLGREFREGDESVEPQPIILSSDMADRYFAGINPIGRRFYRKYQGKRVGEAVVIGVVNAGVAGRSDESARIRIFSPYSAIENNSLLIRMDRPAAPFLQTFRSVAKAEAPMLPIRSINTKAELERRDLQSLLRAMALVSIGACMVLLLAAIGLYAVVALNISQHRREIGIRIAVGARPADVVAMFFGRGVRLALVGLAIGLPCGVGAIMVLMSQVSIPRANLPVLSIGIASTVLVVAALASWLPARKAAAVDPMTVLRST